MVLAEGHNLGVARLSYLPLSPAHCRGRCGSSSSGQPGRGRNGSTRLRSPGPGMSSTPPTLIQVRRKIRSRLSARYSSENIGSAGTGPVPSSGCFSAHCYTRIAVFIRPAPDQTPVTAMALVAMEEARRHNPGIGNAPVLPAPKDPSACMSRSLARDWWRKAVKLAELEPKAGARLALAQAEVRVRPHGSAAQGPMRTRRLEDRRDGAPVLSEGGRGSAQEGPRGVPRGRFHVQLANMRPPGSRKFNRGARIRTGSQSPRSGA